METSTTPDRIVTLHGGPLHNATARIPLSHHGLSPYLADLADEQGNVLTYKLASSGNYRWAGESLPADEFATIQAREEFTGGARVVHDPACSAG